MASIIERDGRWRAQVRRKGVRPVTKTFATEEHAKAWAAQEEKRAEVLRGNIVGDPRNRPTPYQVAGVYVLFRGAEVQYVGRSVHIYRRLNDHARGDRDWDSFRIIACNDSIACEQLEHKLIAKYQPPMNVRMSDKDNRKRRSRLPAEPTSA